MTSYIVAGLGFGDEGKGSIVDYLAELTGIKNNIRYNGGHQAAHYVVKNKMLHCFSQFGSSMLVPNTQTILSKYMLIEPYALSVESNILSTKGIHNPFSRLYIDEKCLVVTPMHKLVNQMREILNRNGSCGLGIGETILDNTRFSNSLKAEDIIDIDTTCDKLRYLLSVKLDHAEQILEQSPFDMNLQDKYNIIKKIDIDEIANDYFDISNRINIDTTDCFYSEPSIYEGAQGVLLDVKYGFHPYVTKTKTTFDNAVQLCKTPYKKIAVMRPYLTRHGNGPFPTEDDTLGMIIPDTNNVYNYWQGKFRVGYQDLLLMKYAISISGKPDYIAMTNIDKINRIDSIELCTSYEYKQNHINIDNLFDYERKGNRYILHGFKKDFARIGRSKEVNYVLNNCKPIYQTFDNYIDYCKFLESDEGIGVPIGIVSFGVESKDKISLMG
jgi:adenylosuccinate synthase